MRDCKNDNDHDLLVRIAEESTEVGKEACKAIRFGLDSINPLEPAAGNNLERLLTEFKQLSVLVAELSNRANDRRRDALFENSRG